VIITDTLNGHTIEDVRRNHDGSVTLYCDSGRVLTLEIFEGVVSVRLKALLDPDQELFAQPSERMRLLEAFQGHTVNYAYHTEAGNLVFVCEPLKHDTKAFHKSAGHREITLTHTDGLINELPPVSAKIAIKPLSLAGKSNL